MRACDVPTPLHFAVVLATASVGEGSERKTQQEVEFRSSSLEELGAHAADFDFLGGWGGGGRAGYGLWS